MVAFIQRSADKRIKQKLNVSHHFAICWQFFIQITERKRSREGGLSRITSNQLRRTRWKFEDERQCDETGSKTVFFYFLGRKRMRTEIKALEGMKTYW